MYSNMSSINDFKSLQHSYKNRSKVSKKNTKVYSTIGASSHSSSERQEDDYYATPPKAVKELLTLEKFSHQILEPCCGEGHISKTLIDAGFDVESSDLVNRGFGDRFCSIMDLTGPYDKDIITNPPYKYATEFCEKCLELITEGHKLAMYLKLTFLETSKRYYLFKKYPINKIYVASKRLGCGKNGEFASVDDDGELYNGGAVCFAWFVWTKGYNGPTIVDFFNFD